MTDDEPLELPDEQEALRVLLRDKLTDETAGKDEARQVLQLAARAMLTIDGDEGYVWALLQTIELLVDSDIDETKRRVALTLNASARMVAMLARQLAPKIDLTPRGVLETIASAEDLGWWLAPPEGETP